jgi:hypothetical protein
VCDRGVDLDGVSGQYIIFRRGLRNVAYVNHHKGIVVYVGGTVDLVWVVSYAVASCNVLVWTAEKVWADVVRTAPVVAA